MHGEIHIFSNFVKFCDCLMDTTSLLSSQARAKKSRNPIQRSPTDHLFLPHPFHELIIFLSEQNQAFHPSTRCSGLSWPAGYNSWRTGSTGGETF